MTHHAYYRPPMKLREGNVFSHVCQSTGGGGSHVTIIHDALDLTVQGSPGPTLANEIWWQRLETCSYLSTRGPLC